MMQLEAEYLRAAEYLAPYYWCDKYKPNLEILRAEWLPAFNDQTVMDEAERMQALPLPPLG
jgi:hypothetical protein